MYEVRRAGDVYRIYDKFNELYVGYTEDHAKANRLAGKTLRKMGFEGQIPAFFIKDRQYGFNFDLSH
jgi:hypothetical protein